MTASAFARWQTVVTRVSIGGAVSKDTEAKGARPDSWNTKPLVSDASPPDQRLSLISWFTDIQHPREYQGRAVEPMRGRSLSGVLSGTESGVYTADDFVGGEMRNGRWMRQGPDKAVAVTPPYGSGEWRLFNVDEDPGETRNLAEAQPELMGRLTEAWEAYAEDVGVVQPQ